MKKPPKPPSKRNEQLAIFCTIVLFLLILFSLPPLVGGQPPNKIDTSHCSGHGLINATDGNCICYSGYFGLRCNRMFCPFGPSWWDYESFRKYLLNLCTNNHQNISPFLHRSIRSYSCAGFNYQLKISSGIAPTRSVQTSVFVTTPQGYALVPVVTRAVAARGLHAQQAPV